MSNVMRWNLAYPLLRYFELSSNPLVYTGGQCIFTMPRRTNAKARAAVIGISPNQISAGGIVRTLNNAITQFSIGGRDYHQGDPVPLALLAGGAIAAPDQFTALGVLQDNARNYFPGEFFPLSDGSRCSGLMLNGNEQIQITLQQPGVLTTQPLAGVTLHCVEFPKDNRIPAGLQKEIDTMWDQFQSGIGQCFWIGTSLNVVAATAFQQLLQAQIQQPHNQRVRRREVRGAQIDPATGNCVETDFAQGFAQLSANNQPPNSDGLAPMRNVIGHGSLNWRDQSDVDLDRNDFSMALVSEAAPTVTSNLRLAHIFEGVQRGTPTLCGPGVF